MATADRPGGKRPWFRRRLAFAGAALLIAPALSLLAGNLWLSSSWGRSWVSRKISTRTGLEAHIDGTSLTPWGGLRIQGLVIEQPPVLRDQVPGPILSVASIRAWPVWKSWLHRRWELRSVEMDSPRVIVPLQLIAHLAPVQGPPKPAVAVNDRPAPVVSILPEPGSRPPLDTLLTIPVPGPLAPSASPRTAPPLVASLAAPPPLNRQPGAAPTAWIEVRGGSFAVVSAGNPMPLTEWSDIDVAIPVAGDAADSLARISSLKALGSQVTTPLVVPLRWQSPILFFGPSGCEAAGISTRFGGKIGLVPGLPIQIETEIPVQNDLKWSLPPHGDWAMKSLCSVGKFEGYLSNPITWSGVWEGKASDITANLAGQPAYTFDRGSMFAVMRGGVASLPEFRLIGDNLSLLGNATALSDGRMAGVLRIVAEPSLASGITSRLQRSGARIAFGQLGTPDRLAADLQMIGNVDGSMVQLGTGGDTIDGRDAVRLLKGPPGSSQ